MIAKIGYDGQGEPVVESVRDITGKNKRELTRTIRYDSLGRLFKQSIIEEYQWAAGCRLQQQAEAAEIITQSSGDGVRTVRTLYALSDAQDTAMAQHASTRAAINLAMGRAGTRGETLLRLVVIENRALNQAAKIMGIPDRVISECLRFALDALARHYGLA